MVSRRCLYRVQSRRVLDRAVVVLLENEVGVRKWVLVCCSGGKMDGIYNVSRCSKRYTYMLTASV